MSRSEHDLPGSDETQPDSTGSRLSPDDVTVVEPRVPVGDIAFDADSETFDADSETFDADSETFDAESETFDAESETFDADSETFDADSSPSTSAIARGQATDPDFGPPEVSTPAQGGGEPGKMPEPGDRIGEEFEIIRLLGAGGMGSVFLGRDLRLGRKVAIKVMKLEGKDRATRERFAALFDSEARATARLNHPNVVTIHQVGRAFGMPYLVLELLQGASLSERMQAEPLPIVEGVRILCEVCRALEHAHGQGLVHRDLKPQNIFLTDDGQLKVVDFGLATFDPARVRAPDGRRQRETLSEAFAVGGSSDEGAVAGSPAYMAPEQWRAQEQDARTDIWACGVILYQMLTGHVPFTRPLDVLGDKPVPRPSARAPDAPAALEAIVLRCMARERSERFQDARALLEALQAWQSGARSDPGGAPYRFLEAFGEADAGWFFGRDRETAQLAHMLQRRPLIAIVGPSGAGKSSLARAGVLGRLRARGEAWQTLVMVPGRRPLTTLRARLAALAPERFAALGGDDVDLRQRPGFVGEVLRDHARAAGVRLAVLIDQFEEIVTLTDDDAEREAFAQAILSAADDPEGPIRVMVTMRDDFLAPLGALPALRDAVVGSLYALGPPDEASMARAVQGPAQAAGFELEAGLGEAMVADLRGEAAPLPLLQFAASQLWEARDRERRRLTHAALEALGGVAGVLATHAESLVSGLDKADLEAAKMLLCALVTPSGTRRAVPRAELLDGQADARRGADVLDRLIGGRLLTVSRDAGEPVVQLAHESLIARWDRLQQWLGDDQDRRHVAERLREAATHWRDAGEPREMLWGGAPLSQVDAFFADDATLGALEQRFVRASRRADRRSRNLRRAAIAMVLLTATGIAIGSSVAMLALRDREQAAQAAAEQARRAEAHAKEAAARAETERRQGFARVLGAWSESKQESDAMAALLLAREAVRLAPMPATLGALGAAIYASLERRVLPGDAPVRFVRWDGSGLVTVDGRGLVRRWTDDGHPIAATRVSGTPSAVATASTAGATGRDDRLLVGTADGRVVEITREGEQAERLPAGAKVHDFAANDRTVAVARADGAVWLLEHGAAPGTARAVATHQGAALVVRWSPAREGFVSGGADGHVRRVGHAGDAVQTLGKHEDAVASMASDPTGALVVTGSLDGSVGLWPAEGSARMLRGHDGWVTAVAVSDDGTLVASGSNDESVRLWRADGVFLNRIGEHDYGISALRFAPGEARLLTVSLDGSAAIFGADAKRQARLTGHEQPLLDGVWSPDGRQVATASEDARTRIWASRPSALASIPGGACEVGRVEILPGGMAALAWGEGDLFDPCPAGPTRLWERAEHVGEDRPPRRLPAPEQPIRGLVAVDASAAVAVYEGGRAERLDHEGRSQGVIPGDWQLVAADDAGFALASAEGALARFDAQGHARGRTTAHGPVRRLVACGGGAAVLHADGSATWLDDAGHEARLPAQANAAAWIACATRPNGGAWVVRGDEAGAVRVDVVGDSAAAGAGATVEHAHAGALVGVAVLPAQGERPALVVSAGRDGHVRFARLEAPAQASASVEVPGGAIAAMAPDVRGGRVLVLGGDGVARLYDAAGALVCALRSPDGEATGIALSRDGGVAALVVRGTGATLVPVDREALLALADARSSRRLRPAEREAVGLAPEPDAAGETETAAPQHTR